MISATSVQADAPVATPVIAARGLTKRYGAFEAVRGIDFEVPPGEAFGLLGPNGAGKSTTLRMIGGVSQRTSGDLEIMGLDPERHGPEVRARLGVVPQENNLDEELTARDNLIVYGRYFGLPFSYLRPKSGQLLEFAQLTEKANARVEGLSGGMKRRLVIARALVNEPQVLLLDEPTTGLDPQARHVLWDRLFRLKEQGTSLILTTHHMDEAEQLCDRLIVVDHGQIMAEGSPAALIREHSSREVVELRFGTDRNAVVAGELQSRIAGGSCRRHQHDAGSRADTPGLAFPAGLVERVEALPDRVLVYTPDGEAALGAVSHLGHIPVTSLVRRSSLEDVFLTLTGRSLID